MLQTCIVHLIRHSLDYTTWKERKRVAAALRPIYMAPNAEAAVAALDSFERGPWGARFPTVVAAWRRAWTHVIPFFAFSPEVRRVIYTTNGLEECARAAAEDHQDPRPLPDRRSRDQIALAGPAEHYAAVDVVAGGDVAIRHARP